jgi:hypothetical protein
LGLIPFFINGGKKMEELSHVGMSNCFLCNKLKEIILDRRLKNRLPREAVYNKEPCDQCKEYMQKGIILISVRDGESGENPYRTGGWWVLKEEAVKNFVSEPLLSSVLKFRVMFIDDTACERIGLKKGGQ